MTVLRHHPWCVDDDGKVECVCGLEAELVRCEGQADGWCHSYDPDDREPPNDYWQDEP